MSVPSQRRTSSYKRRRRSHHSLTPVGYKECPKCKQPVRPHRACPNCGSYKGKTVLDTSKKLKRKTAKK